MALTRTLSETEAEQEIENLCRRGVLETAVTRRYPSECHLQHMIDRSVCAS